MYDRSVKVLDMQDAQYFANLRDVLRHCGVNPSGTIQVSDPFLFRLYSLFRWFNDLNTFFPQFFFANGSRNSQRRRSR